MTTLLQTLSRVAIAASLLLFTWSANAQEAAGTLVTKVFAFNLAAGASGNPITLPTNRPIQLSGVTLTPGVRGVGQVSLLRIPAQFIEWVGLDSTSGAAITQGFSGSPGTKIVFIDFSHQVQVEVASPDTIRVRNLSSGSRQVRLLMMHAQ